MPTSAPEIRKKLSPRLFSRGGLSCPHCQTSMGEALESCPRCGFRLDACSDVLGTHAPALDFLIDPGNILPESANGQLAPIHQELQKKFPQVSLSLCLIELNPPFKVNELAFWLINVAPDSNADRAWKIVLVFDVAKHEAGLASGYGIEPFIKPTTWTELLTKTNAEAHRSDWTSALELLVNEAIPLLEDAKREATTRTKKASK